MSPRSRPAAGTARVTRYTLGGVAAIVAASLALAACGSSGKSSSNPLTGSGGGSSASVVVGSANFPENQLIAEVYILALQHKGVKVTPKLNIGSREVYYPEIKKGAISILPEYNGALLLTSVDPKSNAASTSEVNSDLQAKLPSTLELLNSAPAQNKDSVTVTRTLAAKDHLKSISDLKPFAKKLVIGGPPEFKTRQEGLLGLEHIYGLHFKNFTALDESGPVTLKALTTNRVQAADVFTTTPQIITDHLVSLADPKGLFAAQNVTPLVYKKAMTPTIMNTLNAVSAKLTTQALLAMDKAVIIDHANYSTVATGFLQHVGLM